ncbi:ABC transporter permease [Agarivorans sp. MS3-6]|uniref:ABC transporter permease n=1 Tax=Agarivorans sp. TSD2052 TaxID=2937286 RepID=UPI0020106866|nr:ABC transporter permease subunit [Agarivorans sp. TSD2052]UPW16946.1 ABC transporter permease subunit [Agarivorans sp. TSD2052]
MLRYLLRRINLLIITFLIINIIAFVFQQKQSVLIESDDMWISQYLQFVWHNLNGDLGISSVTGKPVFDELIVFLPATLELCFSAFLLSFLVGIPLGTLAGIYHQHWIRNTILSLTMIGYSIPVFWLALLLVMNSSVLLGWFPVSGRYNLLLEIPQITGFGIIDVMWLEPQARWPAFMSILSHLLLPTIVLAVVPTTEVIRQLSNSMAQVMSQNYIKAAATKGLSKTQIVMRHALHNALPPILPSLGLQFGNVLTMAMVLEVVFAWPGIGRWLISSIYQQDYVAIQGGMLAIATLVICTFVLTDIFTALIHPLRRREVYAQQ